MNSKSTSKIDTITPRPVLLLAAAAIALRLLLLLGRGDYLAFDEGWYLLLARSLFTGDGYSLVGFPHTALSPLFPVLAGAAGAVIDSWVWGGRLVAAVASGLVVLPAWAVFRRLAPERTALIAAALVVVLPSLAPFVVPFWIGADLWVGAESLLHLFLYTGVALWLGADEGDDEAAGSGASDPRGAPGGRGWFGTVAWAWLGAGAAFGLAFLARPEAIITWGLLGLVALGLAAVARSPRRLYGAVLMGVGFLLLASPYWLYVHDASGRWGLTGRGVSLSTVAAGAVAGSRPGATRTIEGMLWQDDVAYRERLYGLDETGLRLRSDYWGVPPRDTAGDAPEPGPGPDTAGLGVGAPDGSATDTPRPTTGMIGADSPPDTQPAVVGQAPRPPPSPVSLYLRAMRIIVPVLLWLFVLLGAIQPRGWDVLRRELPVAGALAGTSLAIAVVVAADPRTQLFLVPLLMLYAARGFALIQDRVDARWPDAPLRPGFVELLLAATALVWLLGIDARRLWLSLAVGSPHHIVAEQNRAVAEELDTLVDAPGPVASWHPAIAVYADRDWRVLPHADLPGIIRYLDAAGADLAVLSAYYPPNLGVENLGTRYLILPIPDAAGDVARWRLEPVQGDSIRTVGRLAPTQGPADDDD